MEHEPPGGPERESRSRGVPDIEPELLDRYLAGHATPTEHARVEALIQAYPAIRERVEQLRTVLGQVAQVPHYSSGELAARARTIRANAERRPMGVEVPLRGAGRGAPASAWWWRGASLVAAACAVIAMGELAIRSGGWRMAPQAVRELASPAGRRVTVTLHDGSQIVMGPASRVRVPADFGTAKRELELVEGEAVFTVVHDARRPFAVRTSRVTVRDVGTTFAVRAYGDDADEWVAVAEGEVTLGAASLRARDLATIDARGDVRVEHGVDVSRDLAWTRGQIVFENMPLGDAVRELSRTYNLDIRVADSALAQKLVTASFADEPIDEVLGVVTTAVGGRYVRTGRTVVIRRAVVPAGRESGPGNGTSRIALAERPR